MAIPGAGVKVLSGLRQARRRGIRLGSGLGAGALKTIEQRLAALQARVREIHSMTSGASAEVQEEAQERIQSALMVSSQLSQLLSQGYRDQADDALTNLEAELYAFETYLGDLDPSEINASHSIPRSGSSPITRMGENVVAPGATGSYTWLWIVGGVAAVGGLLLYLESR